MPRWTNKGGTPISNAQKTAFRQEFGIQGQLDDHNERIGDLEAQLPITQDSIQDAITDPAALRAVVFADISYASNEEAYAAGLPIGAIFYNTTLDALQSVTTPDLNDPIILYTFDEGSGDDVVNHGSLAPDGTVDAGTIVYSSTGATISVTAGTGTIPSTNLTAATLMWAFKWDADDVGEYGLFANPANDILLTVRQNPNVPKFRFDDTNCSASWAQLYDGNWHILTGLYDGENIFLYLDGVLLQKTAAVGKDVTLTSIVVGAFNNGAGIFPGEHGISRLYDFALSPTERGVAEQEIRTAMESRGVTFPVAKQVVLVGDSILDSIDSGMVTYGQGYPWGRNMAVGGYGIANLITQGTEVDEQLVEGIRNSLVVAIGRNDGAANANFMTQLQSYCASRFSAGWDDVFVCTILPSTASGFNTWRNARNAEIRANSGNWHSGYIDNGADGVIGLDSAAANTGIYYDGTHFEPSGPGYARMARNIIAGLNYHFNVSLNILTDYSPAHYVHVNESTITPKTDGVGINTMSDLGSANKTYTGQTSHLPTYDADGINGGPSVAFNGDQSFYHTFAIGGSTGIMTAFHVISVNAGQSGLRGFHSTHAAVGSDHKEFMFLSRVSGSSNWGTFHSGGDEPANSDIQGDGPLILEVERPGLDGRYFINGVADGTFDDAQGQNTGNLGGLYGAGQAFAGKWGATIIFLDVMTPDEKRRIRRKLGQQFSITV